MPVWEKGASTPTVLVKQKVSKLPKVTYQYLFPVQQLCI